MEGQMEDKRGTAEGGGYEPPEVNDHGDLVELTTAIGLTGTEDGASKSLPFHHNLSLPSLP
jgi:hypothetical protein